MNAGEERVIESALKEFLGQKEPKNFTASILDRYGQEAETLRAVTQDKPKRHWLGIGAAAAAVIIGLAILGYEWFNRPGVPEGVKLSPSAVLVRDGETFELKEGWALISSGAPDIKLNGTVLSGVNGQVLAVARGVPSDEQLAGIQTWLKANKVSANLNDMEKNMLSNKKHWIVAGGIAVVCVVGDARLDGQLLQAQEEEQEKEQPVKPDDTSSPVDMSKVWEVTGENLLKVLNEDCQLNVRLANESIMLPKGVIAIFPPAGQYSPAIFGPTIQAALASNKLGWTKQEDGSLVIDSLESLSKTPRDCDAQTVDELVKSGDGFSFVRVRRESSDPVYLQMLRHTLNNLRSRNLGEIRLIQEENNVTGLEITDAAFNVQRMLKLMDILEGKTPPKDESPDGGTGSGSASASTAVPFSATLLDLAKRHVAMTGRPMAGAFDNTTVQGCWQIDQSALFEAVLFQNKKALVSQGVCDRVIGKEDAMCVSPVKETRDIGSSAFDWVVTCIHLEHYDENQARAVLNNFTSFNAGALLPIAYYGLIAVDTASNIQAMLKIVALLDKEKAAAANKLKSLDLGPDNNIASPQPEATEQVKLSGLLAQAANHFRGLLYGQSVSSIEFDIGVPASLRPASPVEQVRAGLAPRGLYVAQFDSVAMIIPVGDAMSHAPLVSVEALTQRPDYEIIRVALPLEFIDANSVRAAMKNDIEKLRGFLALGASMNTNLLILTDYAHVLKRLVPIIQAADKE